MLCVSVEKSHEILYQNLLSKLGESKQIQLTLIQEKKVNFWDADQSKPTCII